MGQLRVITVPPDALSPHERAGGYAVILGDCVLPGHFLGRYPTQVLADEACRYFADHYRLTGYPMDGPWRKRAAFTVIQGGLATPNEGDDA